MFFSGSVRSISGRTEMAKYSKFADADYQVKTFRWPYWLLPLLFLSLLLVLGLFIFITINSADRFGCLFHCEQKIDDGGLVPPKDVDAVVADRRNDQNTTGSTSKDEPSREDNTVYVKARWPGEKKKKNPVKTTTQFIIIKGKITFPQQSIPDSIPPHSHLEVKFEDSSVQDASSEELNKTVVSLASYKKGGALTYKIQCSRPKNYRGRTYSVSAVLNMGWTPTKNENDPWLKKGDYLTDTMYTVNIKNSITVYKKDIELAFSGN